MPSPQETRQIKISTPEGADKFLLYRMRVREQLSRPFEIAVDLLSTDSQIDLKRNVAQSATIEMLLRNGGKRYFNGIFQRLSWGGFHGKYALYHATIVPQLWLLTKATDCRIFQMKNVPDILAEVLGGITFRKRLNNTYEAFDYCVQYRESNFDFANRLMEQEGIYYFFEHSDGQHEMILIDDGANHQEWSGYEQVPFYEPGKVRESEVEHVHHWSASYEYQTTHYAAGDFNFRGTKRDYAVKSMIKRDGPESEVFDYPASHYDLPGADDKIRYEGDHYTKVKLQSLQSRYQRVRASSNLMGMCAGHLFTLAGHPRADQNSKHLLISTQIDFVNNEFETGSSTNDARFDCSFEAMPAAEIYRAPLETPPPRVQGPQTAIVVGPSGKEIWTDKFGRVKVQFHWDRQGSSDENSSCWVRVAQFWAGKRWGSIHVPRIGQEVIVEFLDGDVDRPIITGRVYNEAQMPPYDLPDNQTQSGLKTQSTTKGTAENFNELRFEDKKGEEVIYFHAEKDFERVVENNDSLKVGFETKDKGDQTIEIFHDQKVTIGDLKTKDGSQLIKITKDFKQEVGWGNAVIGILKGTRTTTIFGGDSLTIAKGGRKIESYGDHKLTVGKASRIAKIYADDKVTVTKGDQTIKITAGKQSTTAGKSILLKVGNNSITIDNKGVTIKGLKITLQADVKVDVKGPLVDANASGVLTLMGGIAKIN